MFLKVTKCNDSNLVLEILKHDKMWGRQFALGSPIQIVPSFPVIHVPADS